MEQQIAKYLARFGISKPEEVQAIVAHMDVMVCKKGEVLLQEGSFANQCYFIVEGCIRQYQLIDGEEKCLDFFLEESAVIVYDSYLHHKTSSYSLDCIENSILLAGTKEQEEALIKEHPHLNMFTLRFLTEDYNKVQDRLASFVNLSAEERYRWVEENHPQLLHRVPLRYLASYIGVTPESFSRIRKRLQLKA
ncbi:MAG TPA: cyclic nucleotide-binding protein [Cytophagales bacterium]|nr:cyclic nucleotide-binding protein [Cytophagales bacterium]HAA23069.1 cyclic nucleotide-binding protein [Cytophagales bacterium]HAP61993.1 cyclic nucleotide-binding protein [Cytophagales bacterium]